MQTKRILIIDDEAIARERLNRFLNETVGTFQVDFAENGLEAVEKIKRLNPDIVFMDIQMPVYSGFEVLQQLETRTFQVIFQTAFDEFALKAFEESACDYLLKPFTKERFNSALQKALLAQDQREALQQLQKNLLAQRRYLERILYKMGGKLQSLSTDDIYCFVSRDHCTFAHTREKEFIVDFSLGYLEENLNPERFIRSHRNSLVAVDKIKCIGGTANPGIELINGITVQLSRSSRDPVIKRFSALGNHLHLDQPSSLSQVKV